MEVIRTERICLDYDERKVFDKVFDILEDIVVNARDEELHQSAVDACSALEVIWDFVE